MFLPLSERPSFAPHSTTGKITVLYILIFRFFDIRREDEFTLSFHKEISREESVLQLTVVAPRRV
jgi:hypothetical protein